MDWRTRFGEAWGTVRDFLSYTGRVQERAIRDTGEYVAQHYLLWEATLAVAAELYYAITGPWSGVIERFVAASLAGLTILVVAIMIQYAARLLFAPSLIHREQENDLARYVPVKAPKSYRGLLDYLCDLERGISSEAFNESMNALSAETEAVGRMLEKTKDELEGVEDVCFRRRVAIRLGKRLQGRARKMRRLHVRFKKGSTQFSELVAGTAPHFVIAGLSREALSPILDQAKELRQKAMRNKKVSADLRASFATHLGDKQEQLGIASEQFNFVLIDIEKTTAESIDSYDKAIRVLSKAK